MSAGVALVTGGGAGIGRAVAVALAERGQRVAVADLDADAAAETVASTSGRGSAHRVDVTEKGALADLIDSLASEDELTHVFNNAGVGGTKPFDRATPEEWDRIIALNLRSVIDGTTAAYRVMTRQGHGHIVNTASVAGLVPVPLQTLYDTTKFAVVGLSTTLRAEAALRGVRVSVVCPGNVATGIFAKPILGESAVDAAVPPDALSAVDAAAEILRGVDANVDVIVVSEPARELVRLHRDDPDAFREWSETEARRRLGK